MTAASTVLEGRDGYLFLASGQHSVGAYFTGQRRATRSSVTHFNRNIAGRSAFCDKHGIRFSACIFPEKIYALRSLLDFDGDMSSLYLRDYAPQGTDLTAAKVRYPIAHLEDQPAHFTRTDTHYSTLGAIAITRDLLEQDLPDTVSGFETALSPLLTERSGFCGDLGRKMTPPHTETTVGLEMRHLPPMETASNGVQTGNDGLLILQKAPEAATEKTLLIFGDSFFRQLLPLLSLVFSKVVFCRTRFFHRELVAAIAPDVIWTGQAERYLSRCQPDAERPHFLSYPLVRGKTLAPDPNLPELWADMIAQDRLL